ncbi:predicted protein [Aspergillus nidulans FGSC A4]|uniref:Uncharacterized protein n=1 Tax=Emericella nidulans (strain FGSC A4 / ATCC 38163 / CBS 112.46 / NRRL 194 / M139) TaxID=227321 RepID=Q5BFE5_EMENI|nr:hypothetical protein [Aspergillus nidulans FGSC A4]EAA65377.1 predicted protein [Aspergillus nidulans FGSC A4]CBF88883.1 TPA: hypothetical protein ANIA_00735 [Aspergillus nidulans FGSC A4]|eukprot:XP_658339.1 predicted protein [Aspergillus nidulans FGSC A4]
MSQYIHRTKVIEGLRETSRSAGRHTGQSAGWQANPHSGARTRPVRPRDTTTINQNNGPQRSTYTGADNDGNGLKADPLCLQVDIPGRPCRTSMVIRLPVRRKIMKYANVGS